MAELKRNILAVSWAMPPLVFPRALQISRLFKQLSLKGWQTTVLTVSPASVARGVLMDKKLEALYSGYFDVVPIRSPEQSPWFRILARLFPFIKECPDEKRLWARNAMAFARTLIVKKKFSVILTFAQPWSSHLVGLWLHRLTGIPWIAHFSDPWADSPYRSKAGFFHRQAQRLEALIVQEATRLIFVTEGAAALTMDQYPSALKRKVSVIAHGYDAEIMEHLSAPKGTDAFLKIVHTGNFYGPRTPEFFLKALAQLSAQIPLKDLVRVVFVGSVSSEFRSQTRTLGLDGIVEFTGPKSYLEALEYARDADVLLLIEAPSKANNLFFPSKLVDYLLAKKPILALTPTNGPAIELLNRLGGFIVEPHDTEGICRALSILIERKGTHALEVRDDFQEAIKPYDIVETSKTFHDLLIDVLADS